MDLDFDKEIISDVSSDEEKEKLPHINQDKSPPTTAAKNKKREVPRDQKSASKEYGAAQDVRRQSGRMRRPSRAAAINLMQQAELNATRKIAADRKKQTALMTMQTPPANRRQVEPDSQNSNTSSVLAPLLGVTSAKFSSGSQGTENTEITYGMESKAFSDSVRKPKSKTGKSVDKKDIRNEVSQKKTQPGQFNSVWETGSTGVLNVAKSDICYICGCQILDKDGANGHYPEMEHFITPGEFFMKFGTELVCNGTKKIFEKGDIDLYHEIHTKGSYGTEPLKDRIDRVNRILNTNVIEDSVTTPLKQFSTTRLVKGKNTIIYDKNFFVPQIKSYLTQFVYAHHICNQIKGHMPTLQGSIDLNFNEHGEAIPNHNQDIFYRYADILYEVINNPPKKVERSRGTPYFKDFNDGKKCYIAAPIPNQYTIEAQYIKNCWEGASKDEIKRRIVDNMLLHSKILREQRFKCTVQRLKNFDYIRGFTTLIPENINSEGSEPQIEPIINDELRAIQSQTEEDMSVIDNASCVNDCVPAHYNIDNKIFTSIVEPKEDKKRELYKIIGPDKDGADPVFNIDVLKEVLEPYKAIANLTASRIIYKTHISNRECAVPAPPPTILSSSSSGVKLQPITRKGGKRTKRRRGRGKSKKKVTRKKRVKRRKTVKKIKRKRRTTRKR